MRPGPRALVLGVAALYVATALLLGGRHLDEPGLYYDEVIQAGPALAFLHADEVPMRIPGARAVRVPGGWLPWMTQPYMGALKSQLLIPVFAVADADAQTLRGTTLVWALLGLPLLMLFANRLAGLAVALLAGALLAVDPSLLFIARHDWGSFALGFVLRCAALWALLAGFRSGNMAAIAGGGLCLGLGVYNKIDFGVFVLAAAAALCVSAPGRVRQELATRPRGAAALLLGFVAGAVPLWLALPGALSVAGSAARGTALLAELGEKWTVLESVLDGSYFLRLMQGGGRFEDLATVPGAGPAAGFAVFVAGAAVLLGFQTLRRRAPADQATRFFLATALLTLLGIVLLPRAVRAHHFLNAWPFPQLVVASAAVLLWTRAARLTARAAAVVLVAAALVSSVRLDLLTLESVREHGGRGRWSHAVEDLARSLPSGIQVVSLDWGFDGPIRFVAPEVATEEPIWRLRRGGDAARLRGGSERLYLVHEPPYAVMPYGEALLEALSGLPAGTAEVRIHEDRSGEPVFRSIRFARPHTLVYRDGRMEVILR